MNIYVYCFLAHTVVILFYVYVDAVINDFDICTNVQYVIACINIPLFCVVCLFRDANMYNSPNSMLSQLEKVFFGVSERRTGPDGDCCGPVLSITGISAFAYGQAFGVSGRVVNAALRGKVAAVVHQAAALNGQPAPLNGQAVAATGHVVAASGQAVAVTGQAVAVTGQAVVASGQAAAVTGQDAAVTGKAAVVVHGQAAVVVNGQAAVAVNGLDHAASFSVQVATAVVHV